MASHYSSIGLPIDSERDLERLVAHAAAQAESIEVAGGRYLRWRDPSGAGLILQVDRGRNLIGAHPHFFGDARMLARVMARIERPDETPLDGAFHAWATPDEADEDDGAYPFVFDCPEARRFERFGLPLLAEVQLAAFAHEIEVFDSPEAHAAAQAEEPRFASQSFIPLGLFELQGDSPASLALLTGHVLRSQRRVNGLTGQPFCWIEVETYAATLDVVVDPTLLGQEPRPGGVISGHFWLSGQLDGYDRRTRSFLRSVLGA